MVLLGGQGMNSISPELFLENEILYLSVYVDLNDGKGLRHLPPDQPIHSVPHALSADLAERAKVADGVARVPSANRCWVPRSKINWMPLYPLPAWIR